MFYVIQINKNHTKETDNLKDKYHHMERDRARDGIVFQVSYGT